MLFKKQYIFEYTKSENLVKKVELLYKDKNLKNIKYLIKTTSIQTLVDTLEKINNLEIINLFLICSQNIKIGDFFLSFSLSNKILIIKNIKILILKKLLKDLNADDVAELISELDSVLSKKIIFCCDEQLRKEVKRIRDFDHTKVGSVMNTTIISINENMKASEAQNLLKKKKNEFDFDGDIFVVNENGVVTGKLRIEDLFFLDNLDEKIEKLMDKSFFSIDANEEIGEVIDLFQKYSTNTVAVLNEKQQILGIINSRDIIPEIIDENMDDIFKFYGIINTEDTYLRSTVFEVVKSRIVWLIILLFATTFTTLIIDKFETLGVQWTSGVSSAILVPMIPVITDMAGNSGSQTTATMIQSFAWNEIKKNHFKKIIFKELKIATIIGAIIGVFNFLRLVIYFSIFTISKEKIHLPQTSSVSTVVAASTTTTAAITDAQLFKFGIVGALSSSISLFLVIIFSKILGVIIPFIAIKLNYDPATFSAPILTTLLDTISSLTFFGMGILLLNSVFRLII